jgi:hypothetical protein
MKTNLLNTIFILLSFLIIDLKVNSQTSSPISKGSKGINLSINLSNATKELYESANGDSRFNLDLSAGFSVFATDHFQIGTGLRVISSKYTTSSLKYGLESGIAYYLGKTERDKIQGSVYPYVELAFNYLLENTKDENDNKSNASIFSIGPAAGLTIMLTNSVAISGRIGYMFDRRKPKDGDVQTGNWISPQFSIVFFLYDRGNSMF